MLAPPDERRLAHERDRVEAGAGPQLAGHPEHGQGARELGQAVLARRLDRERTADEPLGVLAGEDPHQPERLDSCRCAGPAGA